MRLKKQSRRQPGRKKLWRQALALFLSVVLLLGMTGPAPALAAQGDVFTENTLVYKVLTESGGTGTAAVRGNTGVPGGALTIPAQVTTSSAIGVVTYTVTGIEAGAFQGAITGSGKQLNFPATLTYIGVSAFQSCSGLSGGLTIPAGVATVDSHAFQDCTGLTQVTFKSTGALSVGANAFAGCTALTALTFAGSAPPAIEAGAFDAATIAHVYVPAGTVSAYQSVLTGLDPGFAGKVSVIGGAPDASVEVDDAAELKAELEKDVPQTVKVTDDIAMTADITLGANHYLEIAANKTVTTGTSTYLRVAAGRILTLSGPGTLKSNRSEGVQDGILVSGVLKLNEGSRLETANTEKAGVAGGSSGSRTLESNGGHITVSGTADGLFGLGTVNLKGGSLTVTQGKKGGANAGNGITAGTLTIEDCAVTLGGSSNSALLADQITFTDSTVTIGGDSFYGIAVNNGGTLTVDGSTITAAKASYFAISVPGNMILRNGSVLNLNNTFGVGAIYSYGLQVSGSGTLTVDDSEISVGNNSAGYTTGTLYGLDLGSAALTGMNGGKLTLAEGARVRGLGTKLSDRGITLTASSGTVVTVGAENGSPSPGGLTAGAYVWNNSLGLFAKTSPPTDMSLSSATVSHGAAAGTAVGDFSATDADSGDTFTYTLVSGTGDTDNSAFTIAGHQLTVNAGPDYLTKSSYSIRVRVTDSGGQTFEKAFTITVPSPYDYTIDLSGSLDTSNSIDSATDGYYVSNGSIILDQNGKSYRITGSTTAHNLMLHPAVTGIDLLLLDGVSITAPAGKPALTLSGDGIFRIATAGDVTLQGGAAAGADALAGDGLLDPNAGSSVILSCGPGTVRLIGGSGAADNSAGRGASGFDFSIIAGAPSFERGTGGNNTTSGLTALDSLTISGSAQPTFSGDYGVLAGNVTVTDQAGASFTGTTSYGIDIHDGLTLSTGGDVSFTGAAVGSDGSGLYFSGADNDHVINLSGFTGTAGVTGNRGMVVPDRSLAITGDGTGTGTLSVISNATGSGENSGNGIHVSGGDLTIDTSAAVSVSAAAQGTALCAGSGHAVIIQNGTVTAGNSTDPSNTGLIYRPTLRHTGGTLNGAPPTPTFSWDVNVTGGLLGDTAAAAGSYAPGAVVTLIANTAPAEQQFKEWTISPAVTFVENTSKTSATAKFTMPAADVTAAAVYQALPDGDDGGDDDDDDDDDNGSGSGSGSGGGGGGTSSGTPSAYIPDSAISVMTEGVKVELSGATKASAEQIKSLSEANREKAVTIQGKDYSITFPRGTMESAAEQSYDFGLRFDTGANLSALRGLAGDSLTLMASFNHSGPLPAEAIITFQVGQEKAGQTLHYYFFNEQTGNLEYLQSAVVAADGTVAVRQSHCSDYIFTDRLLSGQHIAGDPERIAGEDRYGTAVAISKAYFTRGAETVVIARGDNALDALPAVPLAHHYGAPLLLTAPGGLPERVLEEIRTLGAQKAILIGGTGAISAAAEQELKDAGLTVERISGADRYDTAYAIAARLPQSGGQAVLVSGDQAETAFADALSISSWAAYHGVPILYTDSKAEGLPDSTARLLREKSIERTVLVGGEGVIPSRLEALVPNPVRYSGQDRYATNAAVLKALQPESVAVFAVSGKSFADALAGAAAAAQSNGWLILTGAGHTGLSAEQEELLQARQGRAGGLRVFGGPAAVPEGTLETMKELLGL